MEVVASLSQGRTAVAQCGLFTYKSVPVIFETPCRCPKHVELFMKINHNCCIKLVPLFIFIYDARSHIHQIRFNIHKLLHVSGLTDLSSGSVFVQNNRQVILSSPMHGTVLRSSVYDVQGRVCALTYLLTYFMQQSPS